MHNKPNDSELWEPQVENGWYTVPSMEHYRCHKAYIPKTRAYYSALIDLKFDWESSVYGEVRKLLPDDETIPLGKYVSITHYVDNNLFHDQLTGNSATIILHMVNKTPLYWYSKKHITAETPVYSSEFVSARTCAYQIINLCNTIQLLGVPILQKIYMYRDNKYVVDSNTQPHANLHKRHTALSFH